MPETPVYNKNNRIHLLDDIRGFAILAMIVYHGMWYMENFFDFPVIFMHMKLMDFLHPLFVVIFLCVSGISTGFSRNVFRRGAMVYFAGLAITLVTVIFVPAQRIIFGILTLMGFMMLLYGLMKPALDKIPWWILMIVWALLFVIFFGFERTGEVNFLFFKLSIPSVLRQSEYLYPLGITSFGFSSGDYFPILPWGFAFLFGTALSRPVVAGRLPEWFYKVKIPVLGWIGRNALLAYLLHFPIVFGALWIIFSIF